MRQSCACLNTRGNDRLAAGPTRTGCRTRGSRIRVWLLVAAVAGCVAAAVGCDRPSSDAAHSDPRSGKAGTPKMIVIGMDGLDPRLAGAMMDAGDLPNFDRLRREGGFRPLGTSIPPQSPVAWASFITGANPGVHGIFDFIHRDPADQCRPFYAAAETVPSEDGWEVGDHRVPLTFWPFNHDPTQTLLRREGTPFWDYLDARGIPTRVYAIPADYPPSPSHHGHHCCLSGMGTPDLLGSYGTYQHFAEDGPWEPREENGGIRARLRFRDDTARAALRGPANTFLKQKDPPPSTIDFVIHRDPRADAAVIDIQGQRILLSEGEWSDWVQLNFRLEMPSFMPDQTVSGICQFYLREVAPNFRLYVTPINIDPSAPATPISEPPEFVERISDELGLFYTSGFQEDRNARMNELFDDEEYRRQTDDVLAERLRLLDYAMDEFEEGLLFFYFSSTDLQAHIFWWDSDDPHPVRSPEDARRYHEVVKDVYRRMDGVLGDVLERFGDEATVVVMSDHGFANFRRQFHLNRWLRDNGYIAPADCEDLLGLYPDRVGVDWSRTRAYGLGLNGLYLNLKGRERDGIVERGEEREALIRELIAGLEAVRDEDGRAVIRRVYRADEVYRGEATALAPDLIIGYDRDYRTAWTTALGEIPADEPVISDNTSAWSADHCMAAEVVPGVLFANRPIAVEAPSLVDIAPTILAEFGVPVPETMEGRRVLGVGD